MRTLHGVPPDTPAVGRPPAWVAGETDPVIDVTSPLPQYALQVDDNITQPYIRLIEASSVTSINRLASQLWRAGESALLAGSAWPLSLYWFKHAGGDDAFVRRTISSTGFTVKYKQSDALIDREELFEAFSAGKFAIRETQEFPSRHRNGGVPYDTAIATTADVVLFASRFFRALGLVDGDEVSIRISWEGISGRFITADTANLWHQYQQRRSSVDSHSSPEVRFKLADAERDLSESVHQLVGGFLNLFDMFDPAPTVYAQILDHWKRITHTQ